jgi:hypothetical protein
MGLLDALCEGTFVQRPDGRILFFPWGALGRGYALSSDEEHRRLRRATKRLLVLGLVGVPVAASVGMQSLGLGPIAAIGALLAVSGTLCLGWLTRGLEPCPERITRAEANARVVRALRRVWTRADGADGG